MSSADPDQFRVSGTIVEDETGRPLEALIVRAFDKDWVSDDKLGFATTDAQGRFEIRFDKRAFQDLSETHPDLYLRVYEPTGIREIYQTQDAIRWNASQDERYRIRIPGRALDTTR